MKHVWSIRNLFSRLLLPIVVLTSLAACQEEVPGTLPGEVVERIDLKVSGDMQQSYFQQSLQSETGADLVQYQVSGNQQQIHFRIRLEDEKSLLIEVNDASGQQAWENAGQEFSLFPTWDLEDKTRYVTGKMQTGGEVSYDAQIADQFPEGIHVNAFTIIDYDPVNNSVLCRLRDFPMARTNGAGIGEISINGTFKGALISIDD